MAFSGISKTIATTCSRHNTIMAKTASIIVIGDEVLKGQVKDTNSHFMAVHLRSKGVDLRRISTIPDCLEDVSAEVKINSQKFDYVFTTGGIGPTHDDITYEAVANAFGDELVLNEPLADVCRSYSNTTDLNHPRFKMARIPASARLYFSKVAQFPHVSVRNVYMFPGFPELVHKWFGEFCNMLLQENGHFYLKFLCLNLPEGEVAGKLNEVVKMFPNVQFGSYPKLNYNLYKVKVTVESRNEEETLKAYQTLLDKFPDTCVVKLDIDDQSI